RLDYPVESLAGPGPQARGFVKLHMAKRICHDVVIRIEVTEQAVQVRQLRPLSVFHFTPVEAFVEQKSIDEILFADDDASAGKVVLRPLAERQGHSLPAVNVARPGSKLSAFQYALTVGTLVSHVEKVEEIAVSTHALVPRCR